MRIVLQERTVVQQDHLRVPRALLVPIRRVVQHLALLVQLVNTLLLIKHLAYLHVPQAL